MVLQGMIPYRTVRNDLDSGLSITLDGTGPGLYIPTGMYDKQGRQHHGSVTMDHTVVHFEIPAEQPERAARFYRDLFGWNITSAGPAGAGGIEYWMVKTVPGKGWPETAGVNGGLMRRMMPGQAIVNYIGVEDVTGFT